MILSMKIFLVQYLATKEVLVPVANDPIMSERSIRSFRHIECQNLSIISDSIDSRRGLQQFWNGRTKRQSKIGCIRVLMITHMDRSELQLDTIFTKYVYLIPNNYILVVQGRYKFKSNSTHSYQNCNFTYNTSILSDYYKLKAMLIICFFLNFALNQPGKHLRSVYQYIL